MLLTAFAVLMLLVAALMLRRAGDQDAAKPHSAPRSEPMLTLHPLTCACPRLAKVVATATVVGL